MGNLNASQFRSQMQQAQRKAESQIRQAQRKYENDLRRWERDTKRKLDEAARNAQRDYEGNVRQEVSRLNAQQRSAASKPAAVSQTTITYRPAEMVVAERLRQATAERVDRDHDFFCSYAKLDGFDIARTLSDELGKSGADVWFDDDALKVGRSMSREMDRGLAASRAGIVVVTPAYLAGRFWTEKELGALLHKDIVIPVLHKVTFEQLIEFSPFLSDLKGFTTASDDVVVIAAKIFAAVCGEAVV